MRTSYFRAVAVFGAMMAAAVVAVAYGSASATDNGDDQGGGGVGSGEQTGVSTFPADNAANVDGDANTKGSEKMKSTITVNTKKDESTPSDSRCSLREAIQNTNDNARTSSDCKAGSGEDTITFKKGLSGTITLDPSLGPLTVTDPAGLTINGGQGNIAVSGDDKIQVFVLPSESEDAKLAVKNLTVTQGLAGSNDGSFGGGIENDGGTLTVTHSTFSSNNTDASGFGGGIANINGGTLKVTNSTFSGNKAGTAGGGILNDGALEVTYSTFSGNASFVVGGGIDNANDKTATLTLSNTILAKNEGGNIRNVCAGGDCEGTITDGGYNISDDSSFKFTDPTSKNGTDPKLDPNGLQNNGGPTKTIALQKSSPAINYIPKGQNGCGTAIKTDQRGIKRPQGKACDVGAFERKHRR